MPITPLAKPSWLFVPPFELPLTLRIENGRFGALRPKPPPCATTQFIPAGGPRNPTSGDAYVANQIHEAVDLAAAADDCVFAAYSGRVVTSRRRRSPSEVRSTWRSLISAHAAPFRAHNRRDARRPRLLAPAPADRGPQILLRRFLTAHPDRCLSSSPITTMPSTRRGVLRRQPSALACARV